MIYRVNYTYAAPNGALRSGANIQAANDAEEAKRLVREQLIGKFRFLNVTGATVYNTDQAELELPTTNKKK